MMYMKTCTCMINTHISCMFIHVQYVACIYNVHVHDTYTCTYIGAITHLPHTSVKWLIEDRKFRQLAGIWCEGGFHREKKGRE